MIVKIVSSKNHVKIIVVFYTASKINKCQYLMLDVLNVPCYKLSLCASLRIQMEWLPSVKLIGVTGEVVVAAVDPQAWVEAWVEGWEEAWVEGWEEGWVEGWEEEWAQGLAVLPWSTYLPVSWTTPTSPTRSSTDSRLEKSEAPFLWPM